MKRAVGALQTLFGVKCCCSVENAGRTSFVELLLVESQELEVCMIGSSLVGLAIPLDIPTTSSAHESWSLLLMSFPDDCSEDLVPLPQSDTAESGMLPWADRNSDPEGG